MMQAICSSETSTLGRATWCWHPRWQHSLYSLSWKPQILHSPNVIILRAIFNLVNNRSRPAPNQGSKVDSIIQDP
jgi:hypothetical protein